MTRLMNLCAATAHTDHVSRLGRLCVDHQAMAVLNSSEVDAQTKVRSFRPVPFHLHKNKFRTVVSSRRRFSAHSGQLEAIAGVLGLEWFLRKADNHSKRLLFLLDARAVMGAFAKGRSSAPSLFRAVQKKRQLFSWLETCWCDESTLHPNQTQTQPTRPPEVFTEKEHPFASACPRTSTRR